MLMTEVRGLGSDFKGFISESGTRDKVSKAAVWLLLLFLAFFAKKQERQ